MADVVEASWADVTELAASSARRALVELVHIGGAAVPAAPALDPRVVSVSFVPKADSLEGWSRATSDVLSALL